MFPIFLALLSVLVWPFFVVVHLGLFAVDLVDLLSILSPVAVGVDVGLAVFFLLFTWGNVGLLGSLLKRLPGSLPAVRRMRVLWKMAVSLAGFLSVVSPVYSIFPDNSSICSIWVVIFFLEWGVFLALGILLALFGRRGKNWLLFGIGLSLALAGLSDVNGLRALQTAVENSRTAMEESDEGLVENSMGILFGMSQTELDTFDEESLADLQEVSFGVAVFVCAGVFALAALHSAALGFAYVGLALYFAKKTPRFKRRTQKFPQGEFLC